ncbi:protein-glutamate O-methyltransferase CheR [Paraglaciecola aquimarina]|uniref:protein-glutamate O-methyltransferase n=1 Tax=Paraglaciecola aquimarina TaxID=1235557 RepID=A0ABU3T0E7_9ALTE|nr:protein-glutamate O-methyltransferase CheR [Paraglaciecola aquimarina]MDU0355741.1 protein-glutamate O-methyltransferase CheR [Paraglaciecola aquimarina]
MPLDELDLYRYQRFCQFLEQACGIVLGENKQYLVRSRLGPLLKTANVASVNEYIDLIMAGNPKTKSDAIEAMTTNETLWFRDRYPFALLEDVIFPQFSRKNASIRVWSAACASGQEAYSIGMTWLEHKAKASLSRQPNVEIVETDISTDMLEQCKKGEYDKLAIARGLPLQSQQRYFTASDNDKLTVKPELRSLIKFNSINLLDSYGSLGKFEIVFCRNVLIYFSKNVKKQILQKIAACLQDDGILFLGASESIADLSDQFIMIRSNIGLYYQKSRSKPTNSH